MESIIVKELLKWLDEKTRPIDLPRDYSYDELIRLVDIAILEKEGSEMLNDKVREFKEMFNYKMDIHE